jgi:hypothetical protein
VISAGWIKASSYPPRPFIYKSKKEPTPLIYVVAITGHPISYPAYMFGENGPTMAAAQAHYRSLIVGSDRLGTINIRYTSQNGGGGIHIGLV